MSDDICKHGWSRRFCEQCSQARIIASLKGPGDKGMLANPPDDLVERVAQRICNTAGSNWNAENFNQTDDGSYPEDQREYYRMLARAAIAVVLEEAADAVGAVGDHADGGAYINAIRALKQEKGGQ